MPLAAYVTAAPTISQWKATESGVISPQSLTSTVFSLFLQILLYRSWLFRCKVLVFLNDIILCLTFSTVLSLSVLCVYTYGIDFDIFLQTFCLLLAIVCAGLSFRRLGMGYPKRTLTWWDRPDCNFLGYRAWGTMNDSVTVLALTFMCSSTVEMPITVARSTLVKVK